MKLQELAVTRSTAQVAKVFESHFEQRVQFDGLTRQQASNMLQRVRKLVREHKATRAFHQSERNPAYLKLMMMEQALSSRLRENIPVPSDPAAAAKAIAAVKDPKLKTALDKASKNQSMSPDEQKMVAGAALMKTENNTGNFLRESEVQQAQVVLAAQDMVDRVQKMLEDTTEMQFKELPALVDSIKNEVGVDQAAQFNTDAAAALSGLVQNLQASKTSLETALGVVTGQAVGTAAMPPDLGAQPEIPPVDQEADVLPLPEPEEETPGKLGGMSLGRERR